MKTSNLLFILIVNCFFLSSCNKDESDTGNGELTEWVPTTLPIGAKIGWEGYYTYPGESKHYSESIGITQTFIEILNKTDCKSSCVSGGRGVGGPEGFDIIYRLADKLNGVVGASRVAVDLGWIDFEHQVGQAGATVKPKIYIACGISGATQHIVGMWESDIVIAINIHRYAAIFNFADYGIVGDLFEVIPKLLEELEK